jgi:hypothetical protein
MVRKSNAEIPNASLHATLTPDRTGLGRTDRRRRLARCACDDDEPALRRFGALYATARRSGRRAQRRGASSLQYLLALRRVGFRSDRGRRNCLLNAWRCDAGGIPARRGGAGTLPDNASAFRARPSRRGLIIPSRASGGAFGRMISTAALPPSSTDKAATQRRDAPFVRCGQLSCSAQLRARARKTIK